MTPLIAPQLVWPMISTAFDPAALQANSMLPSTSSSATFPAMRPLKTSPIPKSRINSAGARESIQLKTTAAGYCAFDVAFTSLMRSRCRGVPARNRSLPAFICWMTSSGVILSRCSLVRSAWANTLPRLASTAPTAVATPTALQKVRRSNRSLPTLNCEQCIATSFGLHSISAVPLR